MVDPVNNNSGALLRAQSVNNVSTKQAVNSTALAAQSSQKALASRTTNIIQKAKVAGSSSGNLPRGSLVDVLV